MPDIKIPALFKKSFLDGDGILSVRGDEGLLYLLLNSNQSFPQDIAHGEDKLLVLDLKASQEQDVKIGDSETLSLRIKGGAEVGSELDIIRPDEDTSLLDAYNVKQFINDDTMYLVFRFDGQAEIGAALAQKWGNFGVDAGGEIHYAYLRPFRIPGHTSQAVLQEFFHHLRFPQNVVNLKQNPIPGEVLSLTYGGYLSANAGATWGYSITKSTDIALNKLDTTSAVQVEARAALSLGYHLAGHFELQVRRARSDDEKWARVTVKKAKARAFEGAADLDVNAEIETKGLPEKPDAFLEGLLEVRTTDLINKIKPILEADPQELIILLNNKIDDLTKHFFTAYLSKPLEEISSNQEINTLYNKLSEVKTIHDQLGYKVVGFIEDHLDDLDIDSVIDTIKEATKDLKEATGLEKIIDSDVWEFLNVLVDKEWIDLIDNTDDAFDTLKEKIETLKKVNLARLLTFIEAKKKALDLDDLFQKLEQLNPADLKQTAYTHLQELIHRLTGKLTAELSEEDIAKVQNEIKEILDNLQDFKKKLYDQFKEALNRSYELSIAYRYRHAKDNEALLDVEINLAAQEDNKNGVLFPSGTTLMKHALAGDFDKVLQFAANDRLVVRKGLLTHKVNQSSQINVHLFGWKYSTLHELITKTEHMIEQKDNGILHIYDIESQSIEKRKRRGEETEVMLAFNVISKGFQPKGSDLDKVLDAVSSLSSNYALRIKDPVTSEDELLEYLKFADYLKLIPKDYAGQRLDTENNNDHVIGFLREIESQLGIGENKDFGKVSVNYRLRYDGNALLHVFKSSQIDLAAEARRALRTVTAFAYQQFKPFRDMAEAYSEPAFYQHWKNNGLKTNVPGTLDFILDHPGKRISLSRQSRLNLDVLYDIEDDFIKALNRLDRILDRVAAEGGKPDRSDLEKVLKKFTSFQPKLNKWFGFGGRSVIHPFLAVLNRLTTAATGGRAWTTTLELKFEINDKTITKFLVS